MIARPACALALTGLAAALVPAGGGAAERHHRLRLPEPDLPRALAVDESEWAVRPSRTLVAAGVVRLRVYNRGQDDHNLVLRDASGQLQTVSLKPGEAGTINARLRRGSVKLYCGLFEGTPESHEAKGMSAVLRVR